VLRRIERRRSRDARYSEYDQVADTERVRGSFQRVARMRLVLMRIVRGIGGALGARPGVLTAVTAGVLALDLFLPPALLSLIHKPFDYFAFNAWLPELPRYLLNGEVPLQRKLEFIPGLALFWFSADSPFGGVDWGFAVTVSDLARMLLFALLLGVYFALVFHSRTVAVSSGWTSGASGGGASGALASVLGISTGGCTVTGCGAPVIPVVGLGFAGLTSGTLALLAQLSRVATVVVFIALIAGVLYLGWVAGKRTRAPSPSDESALAAPRLGRSQQP
jgi:hypothetical protein